MKLHILFLSFLLLGACAGVQVTDVEHYGNQQFVSVKYRVHFGENESGRADAIAEAKKNCGGGSIKLISEGRNQENGGMIHMGYGMYGNVNKKFKYMKFECLDNVASAEIY